MSDRSFQAHISELLSRLEAVRETDSGWTARCPGHDDNQNSLSIGIGSDNRILLKCFAGCSAAQIVDAIGLSLKDLFPPREDRTTALRRTPPPNKPSKPPEPPPEPATVEALAARKRLPADWLRNTFHLRDLPGGNGVALPYYAPDGSILFERTRAALSAKAGTFQPKGTRLKPYGLWLPRQEDYLILCEGESDTWTLAYHGFPVLGVPGASAAKCLAADHLEGIARLYLWRESDNAGTKFVDSLYRHLRGIGFTGEIRLLAHPQFKDPSDWHISDPERFADAFRELLNNAPTIEDEQKEPEPPREEGFPARQGIPLAGDALHVTIEAATNALAAHPAVYSRGGRLVRLTSAGRLVELDQDTVAEPLCQVAGFYKLNAQGEATPTQPTGLLLRSVAKRGDYPQIREVVAVVDTPIFRPDGSLVDQPGYDPVTRVIYRPTVEFPPISSKPSLQEAQRAAARLLSLVDEFPIVNDDCRAVWLSLVLSIVGRPAVDGPVPLFLFEGAVAGSGKTLCAETAVTIATGRPPAASEWSDDPEEQRKLITATAREQARVAFLDNVNALGGSALDAILTARVHEGRILGSTARTGELPATTVYLASGNNVFLKGDIHRRVVLCRLVPGTERPEERGGFKIPDLPAHVASHRIRLVADAMLILRHHFTSDTPAPSLPELGRYEQWTRVIRGAVYRVTGHDPAASRSLLPSETRGDNVMLGRIFRGLASLPGGSGKPGLSCKQLLQLVERCNLEDLKDALSLWSKEGGLPEVRQLANRLRASRGRVVGELQLLSTEDRTGLSHWYVSRVSADSADFADSKTSAYRAESVNSSNAHIGQLEAESADTAESAPDTAVLNGQGRREYRL